MIEINPRPTASAELVERATGRSSAATHLAACGVPSPAAAAPLPSAGRPTIWAKAVVFATEPLACGSVVTTGLATAAGRWTAADSGAWPAIADVPLPGTRLGAGGPVITVFAAANDGGSALRILRDRVADVRGILRRGISPPFAAEAGPPPRPPGRTA